MSLLTTHERVQVGEHDRLERLPAPAGLQGRAVGIDVPEPEAQERVGQAVQAPARAFRPGLGHRRLPADEAQAAQRIEVLADAGVGNPGVPGDLVRAGLPRRRTVQDGEVGARIAELLTDEELGFGIERPVRRQREGMRRLDWRLLTRDLLGIGRHPTEETVGDGAAFERPVGTKVGNLVERHRLHFELCGATPIERRPRIRYRGIHDREGRPGQEELDRTFVAVPGVLQQRVDAGNAVLEIRQLVEDQRDPPAAAALHRVLGASLTFPPQVLRLPR